MRDHVGLARLAIGLAQGSGVYVLTRSAAQDWGGAHQYAWVCLVLLVGFLPLIPLAGLGRMRTATLLAWTVLAALLLAALGSYDLWRTLSADRPPDRVVFPSPQLIIFGGAALYVLHHLIEPADERRTWRPPYPAYVDGSWRHAFQLGLALAFTGVLAGVLALGAALFGAIGLEPVARALRSAELNLPLLGLAFAGAVHGTDVRPGVIEGARSIGLTLLAWLLPLAAVLIGAFLAALVFTGLQPLWATRRAAQLLTAAAALLIVLLNAAYQDGRGREALPAILRWAGRLAGVLILPLVALAAWGLWLRTGEYGLTPERVAGFATLAALATYAFGYLGAALDRTFWMQPLETVNVLGAVVVVAVILLVLSPLADPARLAVADQLARLRDGRVPADRFDFAALRSGMKRYGRDALAELARSPDAAVAEQARTAAAQASASEALATPPAGAPFARARVHPEGASIPADFRAQAWNAENLRWNAGACVVSDRPCDLDLVDMDGDGTPEVVAVSQVGTVPVVFKHGADGLWRKVGVFYGPQTEAAKAAFATGRLVPLPQIMPDLGAGGTRLRFEPDPGVPDPAASGR